MTADRAVLRVRDLNVYQGRLHAVRGVSFELAASQRLGLIGESGAGKSLTALALMGLLPHGWQASGGVHHRGLDLLRLREREMARVRGHTMSMIFQDPLGALNPSMRIGRQVSTVLQRHLGLSAAEARTRTITALSRVRLPRVDALVKAYPHQLSGGQRQRVLIAMALACQPDVVIADEPTTALDVTIQRGILQLLDRTVQEEQAALLMITHNLAIVAALCDTVAVMYGGLIVETGPVQDVFTSPKHPYTMGLLASQLSWDPDAEVLRDYLPTIPGSVPALRDLPAGCPFRPRCGYEVPQCSERPSLSGGAHQVACWVPLRSQTPAR